MITEPKSLEVPLLLKRIESILSNLELDGALEISSNDLSVLSDHELLEKLLHIHTTHSFRNADVIKKLQRKQKGKKNFAEFLGGYGGSVKQCDFAKLSGLSRQTVNNRLAKNTLLSVDGGSIRLVPLFQIDETKGLELFGLSDVNKILDKAQISTPMKCTFWLNPHSGLGDISPRDFLIKNTGDDLSISKVIVFARRIGKMGY